MLWIQTLSYTVRVIKTRDNLLSRQMQVRLACWLLNSSSTNGSLVYVVNDVRELPVSQSELSHGELHRGITRVWYLLNVLWYRSFFQVWVRSGEREWRWSWREWRLSWQASIYVFSGNGHTPRFWPRDLPMSGLQRDEASREKLAVHNCLNQVKMHSCLSLESSMFGEIPWGHPSSRDQRWNSSTRLEPSSRHVVYWRSSNAIANPKRCCRIPWRTTWRCWLGRTIMAAETDVLLPTSSELEVTLTLMAW